MTADVVRDLSRYDGWPGEPVNGGVGPALEVDGPFALLFHLQPDGRISRWEPWSDVPAARAALREPPAQPHGPR